MRADRLLQILFLLRRHGRLPARRLAELLEVSERTILRDMEALSAAGVPVHSERGRGGGCLLMEGYATDVSGLSSGEAQALFAWTSRAVVSDLGLGSELSTALTKLAATVPQPALEKADALAAVMVVDRRRWFAASEEVPLLPVLRDAAVDRRRLRLSYQSASSERPGTRTVDPYGLVENAGRWYLLASHRGRVRSYRVSRIAAATTLPDRAEIPDDLDLADKWARVRATFEQGSSPVELAVAVDPAVVDQFRMVATMQAAHGQGPSTVGEDQGWPVLHLVARVRQAALGVLLGFGGHVRLLGPADLRDDMVAAARAALAMHPTAR
jgi:predicted DNA-binding transcriptional regulator YafY